ncbi:MAG TPA: polysaccharide deacetylase family protein [Candidatus Paceibacterota bacterium]|nr:polysaccharide deacetylase family protein [Candidatus Paceibacterota bacterium]
MNKKTSILLIIIIALVAGGAIWFFVGKEPVEKEPVLTNLQVTEYQDPAALRKVIDELEDRNLKPATIFVGGELVKNNCQLIKDLDQKGYEIAAFGYALDENGEFIQLADLTKEEQEEIIKNTKEDIENCLGHPIAGFRSQRFSQNKETNEIVRDLGFRWNGSFVVNWHPEASFIPYYSNDYGFSIVSIEGVKNSGYVLCDTAMGSSGKTAKEWRETIQEYFTIHQKEETPFITEFHPYFIANNSDWWNEFIKLLDWFQKQNIVNLTTQDLVNSFCFTCGE